MCFLGHSEMIMVGRHAHVYKKVDSNWPAEVNDGVDICINIQ